MGLALAAGLAGPVVVVGVLVDLVVVGLGFGF